MSAVWGIKIGRMAANWVTGVIGVPSNHKKGFELYIPNMVSSGKQKKEASDVLNIGQVQFWLKGYFCGDLLCYVELNVI